MKKIEHKPKQTSEFNLIKKYFRFYFKIYGKQNLHTLFATMAIHQNYEKKSYI